MTMKVSIVSVVGLLVVTFAFWLGQAEAQHGGGKGRTGPAQGHAPKGGARPGAGKTHPTPPKGKGQQKSKGAPPKKAKKKQKQQDSAQAKPDAKKKHALKKEEKKARKEDDAPHEKHTVKAKARERAKEAESKALAKAGHPAKVALAPGAVPTGSVPLVTDQESISLLQAVHQQLQEVNHDYAGHRRLAMKHVGAALGHLGSSAAQRIGTGKGQVKLPQPVSKAILEEARASLEMVRNQFAAGAATASGHGDAHGAVVKAIREIDLALTVR
jgi:hypothetical protein